MLIFWVITKAGLYFFLFFFYTKKKSKAGGGGEGGGGEGGGGRGKAFWGVWRVSVVQANYNTKFWLPSPRLKILA